MRVMISALRPSKLVRHMSWSTRFRIRQYLKGSIWLIPFVGGVLPFKVFLDRFPHRLRPVAVAALVARAGREAFEAGTRRVESSTEERDPRSVEPSFAARSDRAAIEEELERLDATVELHFDATVDFDRARTADRQGIGGPATTFAAADRRLASG